MPEPGPGGPAGRESEDAAIRSVLRAAREGDREAFGTLVERFERRLFGLALMVVRDPAGAQDVTQEAFVRAFRRLDRFDVSRPFYPWLATIAVRLGQTWRLRRARTIAREGTELDGVPEARGAHDPLGELLRDEASRALWRRVASLPPGERTAVFLHYRQELKVREIAAVLGVTEGTVKTCLFRARRKLRDDWHDAGSRAADHREGNGTSDGTDAEDSR